MTPTSLTREYVKAGSSTHSSCIPRTGLDASRFLTKWPREGVRSGLPCNDAIDLVLPNYASFDAILGSAVEVHNARRI